MPSWSDRYVSYRLGDWLSIVVLIIAYVVLYFIQPHHRLIPSNNDPALSYPLQSQTVSAALLFFFAVGVPLLTFGVFFWLRCNAPHSKSEYQNLVLAFCLCVIMDLITTDVIKKLCGRPRPNFIQLAG
jgi:Na+/H+ antiporter NhaD/arsenite permease-like protein